MYVYIYNLDFTQAASSTSCILHTEGITNILKKLAGH